jgi:Flp pilus assembly protein TadB
MQSQDHRSLIDQVLEARTEREIDAAEEAADKWLDSNPSDLQVVIARERLAEKRHKLRDPRRKVRRVSLVTSTTALVLVGLLSFALTGSWLLAAVIGVVAGIDVACWVRDAGTLLTSGIDSDA